MRATGTRVERGRRERIATSVAIASILTCWGAIGCDAPSDRADPSRPNVLLVTIDTLRADRLSSYGYGRRTTPYLDELAASGIRFERAYASSPWTAPSIVSLLTSLRPGVHGVERGRVSGPDVVQQEVVPDSVASWPPLLKEAGYRTFGVTANLHLQDRFGFARGFDRYRCLGFRDADAVGRVIDSWRREIRSAEPWFVWVHLLDPHAPYTPRAPWIDRYRPGYEEDWRVVRDVLVPEGYRKFGFLPGSDLHALVAALYDSEIAHTDAAVRELATTLDVDENDLVVVTADHGEEFLEHGRLGHGTSLFEEQIRVPLILRLPGSARAGRVVAAPVSGLDVLPTVLDVLGVEAPRSLQGRSLLPLLDRREAEARAIGASLGRFAEIASDAIVLGDWKYLEPRGRTGAKMLFELATDPRERRNRIADQAERAAAFANLLAAQRAADGERSAAPVLAELSREEAEQLEALGYVGEGAAKAR